MTREQKAFEASKRFEKSLAESDIASLSRSDMCFAFQLGIKWADANPKSPWISVENDLPCNHEELIDREIPTYTLYVVVRLKDGTVGSSRMIKIPDDNWVWPFNVSHWFPIPQLPKE